jgi:very-short-patch-repair endonuclease
MKSMLDLPMYYGAQSFLFKFAKDMRDNPTDAEKTLWLTLNKPPFDILKFRRQHPISSYIADFYCHRLKLVIEVDGGYHTAQEQLEYDSFRDEDMQKLGICVLRFTNAEILSSIEDVMLIIISHIKIVIPDNYSPKLDKVC